MNKGDKLYIRIDYKIGNMEMTVQDFHDHLAYVEKVASERYFLGGGFTNTDGGMLLFQADSLEEAQKVSKNDPIINSGLYRCEVFEWELVVLSDIDSKG